MSLDNIRFESIVRLARQEPPPPIDVTGQVAHRISARLPLPQNDWPLWGATGLSVAAALVVLVLTFQQGDLFNDPLAQWLRPLVVVMQ